MHAQKTMMNSIVLHKGLEGIRGITATTANKNSRTFPLAKCGFEQVAYLNLSFIFCKIWIIAACRMVLRVK